MAKRIRWTEEADVVVVGFGGAGAATAVAAHDAGARVLLLEKQPGDTPSRTRHTPSTQMSGGNWACPTDLDKTILYQQGLARIANETLDGERKELISVFAQYMLTNTDWMKKIGVEVGGEESLSRAFAKGIAGNVKFSEGRLLVSEFPELPGADSCAIRWPRVAGKYRGGAALFKALSEAVQKRDIPVMWETPTLHLVMRNGAIRGVVARRAGKEIGILARRGVVLTCGGFEFNDRMKEDYLRVNPTHFYGSPGNTGDGVSMVMEVGAALWHMNAACWRVTMKFPEYPVSFSTQHHETAGIFVDKRGRRFTNERFKLHSFGYELTNYDPHAMCYPKVPCWWIFDEKRRAFGPLSSAHGPCNPPGGIMGDIHYVWSEDNQPEIDRGWILKARTVEDLARKMLADPDNGGFMTPLVLRRTVKEYNQFCKKGEDADFGKPKQWLQPLLDPPYYAVKLWPGGPNTLGGPKRNTRAQVLRVDNTPLPRLYAAGELGSVWGMIYEGGGNISECMAFGRIAGAHAAAEKIWK
jgi:3-oxosteroid 1-dehydrogenase